MHFVYVTSPTLRISGKICDGSRFWAPIHVSWRQDGVGSCCITRWTDAHASLIGLHSPTYQRSPVSSDILCSQNFLISWHYNNNWFHTLILTASCQRNFTPHCNEKDLSPVYDISLVSKCVTILVVLQTERAIVGTMYCHAHAVVQDIGQVF